MDCTCHYYAMLALSRICGMKKTCAYELAYSSQFVDDAVVDYISFEGDDFGIQWEEINGEKSIKGISTCHSYFKIKTLNYQSMIQNTSAFHFIPGIEGSSFSRRMRCKKDSSLARGMVEKALKNRDPICLGMALHAYADTWSHQGFSGLISRENDIRDLSKKGRIWMSFKEWFLFLLAKCFRSRDRIFDRILPAYGHVQALSFPDLSYLHWSYTYDASGSFHEDMTESGEINNPKRYIECFRNIESFIRDYLKKYPFLKEKERDGQFMDEFYQLLCFRASERSRNRKWRSFLKKYGFFDNDDPALYYDKSLWYKCAFADYSSKAFSSRTVKGIHLKPGVAESEWYRFSNHSRWYRDTFFSLAKKCGLDIPR